MQKAKKKSFKKSKKGLENLEKRLSKMSSQIKISLDNPINSKEVTEKDHYLQFIPAKIHFNDKAKIKPFFNDYIIEKDNELSSVLRGRPLNGKLVEMQDQNAVVLKVPNASNQIRADLIEDDEMNGHSSSNEIECRTMNVCEKITVWNYDLPSDKGTDPLSKALLYANLAKVLNSE